MMKSCESQPKKMNAASENKRIINGGGRWREGFQILTITLLSLLLPLSFLLLSRISTLHYILTASPPAPSSIHLYRTITNSTLVPCIIIVIILVHSLLSFVGVAALLHALTGRIAFFFMRALQLQYSELPDAIVWSRPRPGRLYVSWMLLCTLQVCVGLGIEASIAAGIDGSAFIHRHDQMIRKGTMFISTDQSSLLITISRVLFLLGLHETMLFWSRWVVKPVVDDTVLGYNSNSVSDHYRKNNEELGWVEKAAMAASLGALWWWRLRDEVHSLQLVVPEVMMMMSSSSRKGPFYHIVGAADLVAWCLYYLTASVGIIRLFNCVICFHPRTLVSSTNNNTGDHVHEEI